MKYCLSLSLLAVLVSLPGQLISNSYYWDPDGPAGRPVTSFAIDPRDSQTLYAQTPGRGVYKSKDGGASWASMSLGLPKYLVRSLVIDPQNPETLYVAGLGGVFKSINGGKSWGPSNLSSKRTLESPRRLVMDPKNSSTLYYAAISGKVFKSVDGGKTWNPMSFGLPEYSDVGALAIDPQNTSVLYLGVSFKAGALFKSVNAAQSWQLSNKGLPHNADGTSLAIDPRKPSTLYLGTNNGFFKSADAAQSWKRIAIGLAQSLRGEDTIYASCISIDPKDPSILYMGTEGDGTVESVDRGETWFPLDMGVLNKDVYSIAIDSHNPKILYAGTFKEAIKSMDGGQSWVPMIAGLPHSLPTDADEIKNDFVTLNDEEADQLKKVTIAFIFVGFLASLLAYLYFSRKKRKTSTVQK